MNERLRKLFPSLVGASIDYSFKKKFEGALSIEQNIRSERERIERDVEKALSVGGELCVMLLAELTASYVHQPYYMAVRSAIQMRRYRPTVLEYMKLDAEQRAKRLMEVLGKPLKGDKHRELKVTALRYFLITYPHRTKSFKKLLTREEYLIVA